MAILVTAAPAISAVTCVELLQAGRTLSCWITSPTQSLR